MSGGFSNPLVGGGGALVYPSIHSPNFTAGVSGWTVNKDGSAEFNNLSIRGVFNGTNYVIKTAGAFFYNGTPALGNLIYSIVSSALGANDGLGNLALPGATSYTQVSGIFYAIQTYLNATSYLTASSAGGPYTTIGLISFNSVQLGFSLTSGTAGLTISADGTILLNSTLKNLYLQGNPGVVLNGASQSLYASDPVGGNTETWHAMPLAAQWANPGAGFTQCQYRLVGSPPQLVEIIGTPTFTANGVTGLASGSPISTALPSQYWPARLGGPVTMAVTGGSGSTIAANKTPDIRVTTAGVVTINGVTCAVTNGLTVNLFFHGFYSLDA